MYTIEQKLSSPKNLKTPGDKPVDAHAPNSSLISMLGGETEHVSMPDSLKNRFENGPSVRVHYGSKEPAEFGASAFAYGDDVYLGPGQERCLEHELNHVAQQRMGLVKPQGVVGGLNVNFESGLEDGADKGVLDRPPEIGGSEPLVAQFYIPRVMQQGTTCGIYALTTALMDLANEQKPQSQQARTDQENRTHLIAQKLKDYAIAQGLSSQGEIYNANVLSQLANYFVDTATNNITQDQNEQNQINTTKDYLAGVMSITVTFNSRTRMKAIIRSANNHNVRVLMAFGAANDNHSLPSELPVTPDTMYNAHWGVIKPIPEGGGFKRDKIGIREGNVDNLNFKIFKGRANSRITLNKLYKSHSRLSDTMNWQGYFDTLQDPDLATAQGNLAARKVILNQQHNLNKHFANMVSINEKAYLKGKLVLVGTENDIGAVLQDIN